MEFNRRMFHAGALAVAIAIMAVPAFAASVRAAEDPPGGAGARPDSAIRTDSSAAQPAAPTAAPAADTTMPAPAPADTARLVPVPAADTSLAPAPAPQAAPPASPPAREALEKIRKQRRAQPAKTTPAAGDTSAALVNAWTKGANWVTVNLGYARSGEPGAGPGGYGVGLGLRHMLGTKWSVAASGGFEQLGRFDTAKEYEYPFMLQVARHFNWKTAVRPYLETGWGFFQHQYRGTGQDKTAGLSGTFLTGGIDLPSGARSVVGAFARYEYLSNKQGPPNPVFDGQRSFAVRYSLRVTWSLVF